MLYADSLTAVSAPGFRFAGEGTPAGLFETFRRSIERVAALPCDDLIAPHPGFVGLEGKLDRRRGGEPDSFLDPEACRAYAAAASRGLDRRTEQESPAESSAPQPNAGR